MGRHNFLLLSNQLFYYISLNVQTEILQVSSAMFLPLEEREMSSGAQLLTLAIHFIFLSGLSLLPASSISQEFTSSFFVDKAQILKTKKLHQRQRKDGPSGND
ncbi:hypothetical protein ILYODFUR_011405 [Ilyodon furcidens]|uniref:Uncharacterized protein n=1 Tax=Ilyodon furcidens TaxID=33524 RepID=A0ABV0UR07_9TELE